MSSWQECLCFFTTDFKTQKYHWFVLFMPHFSVKVGLPKWLTVNNLHNDTVYLEHMWSVAAGKERQEDTNAEKADAETSVLHWKSIVGPSCFEWAFCPRSTDDTKLSSRVSYWNVDLKKTHFSAPLRGSLLLFLAVDDTVQVSGSSVPKEKAEGAMAAFRGLQMAKTKTCRSQPVCWIS